MTKRPKAISFAELTVRAMDDRECRYDWSWLLCYYIKAWEIRNVRAFLEQEKTLVNAHFGWFHYHEICDRVLAMATLQINEAEAAIKSGDFAGLSKYSRFLINKILVPECAREFTSLAGAVEKHGLQLDIPNDGGR